MTYKQNITAILECYFAGFKEEIIDSACNRILEQEPCEVSEYDKDHIWYKGNQYISLRRFLEVKAVTPQEPKTGHWKRNETIRLTYCSECGFGQHIDEFRTYNYCPNCGARMVEPQERSEE